MSDFESWSPEHHPFALLPQSDAPDETWQADSPLVGRPSEERQFWIELRELVGESFEDARRQRVLDMNRKPATRIAQPPAHCRCEQDKWCLAFYRNVESGADEFPADMLEWLIPHIATVEAACPAKLHYQSVLLDEELARDVTLDVDDPEAAAAVFYAKVDDDHALYLARTEEGGRFMDRSGPAPHRFASDDMQPEGGLFADRDREDWTTRIRSFEMEKKRELRDEMLVLGLNPADLAPWVKRAIEFKRTDALNTHRAEVARAEKLGREGEYVAAPAVAPESQIRLRAYSYCLHFLKQGKTPKV